MRIALAYLGVVLIWSTTPLTIKWSLESVGFVFAVGLRMAIGALCLLLFMWLTQKRLDWHPKAALTYCAVAMQMYGSMVIVYWSAQFIPSGWISVISGLTPLITAVFSALYLGERSLSFGKLLSYIMGVAGLAVMFGSALEINHAAVLGIVGILVGISLHALSSVLVKRIDAKLPALSQVTGGLLVSLPLYFLTWRVAEGQLPPEFPLRSLASILYLGMVATTLGFVFYYYLLVHLAATQVILVTLICPVMALLLGHALNHEPLTERIVIGTGLILAALFIHSFYDWLVGLRRRGNIPTNKEAS